MVRLARPLVWLVLTPWLVASAPPASAQFAPWTWGWGATPAPTQVAAPVQPAAEEEAEATGAPVAPKPAEIE